MFLNFASNSAILVFLVGQVEPVSLGNAVARVLVVSLFIAVVGFGTAIWLKKRNGHAGQAADKTQIRSLLKGKLFSGSGGDIIILSSKRVGPGQILVDVDWAGRRILLGCTANGIASLSEDKSSIKTLPESEAECGL